MIMASVASRVAMSLGNRPFADPEVTADEMRGLGSDVLGYHGLDKPGGSPSIDNGCYAIESIDSNSDRVTFRNPYCMTAGIIRIGPVSVGLSFNPCFLVLRVDNGTGASPVISLDTYQSVGAIQEAQMSDMSQCLVPLYKFVHEASGWQVECDFRSAPVAVMWEAY